MTLRQSAASEPRGSVWSVFNNTLFKVRHEYRDPLDQQRARTLIITSEALAVLGIVSGLVLYAVNPVFYTLDSTMPPLLVAVVMVAAVVALVQWGRVRAASLLFVAVLIAVPIAENWDAGLYGPAAIMFALPVLSASQLLGSRWGYASLIPTIAALAVIAYRGEIIIAPAAVTPSQALQSVASHVIEGSVYLTITAALSGQLSTSLHRWAEQAQRRAQELEAAASVSEAAASAPSLGTLLNLAVERIRDAFGFYHAQVFLLDQEQRMARLEASTGRAGVALLARGHALPVGSRSVIGQATYTAKPVVINDVHADPTHRPNDLLPNTRAELALPLIVAGQVIGALDVQSDATNVFNENEINSLQVMANQLAGYIEKARLLSDLQARTTEQQRLIEEAQNNLRQIEDLNRRLTREGWGDYLRSQRARGTLGFTLTGGAVHADPNWTAPMRQAFQGEHSVIIRQDQQAHIAALPLRVRGEVIGVLEIERDGSKPWTERELEMAETLIDRLAVALENARLYEQATLAAEREHMVNKIAQNVQEAESVDEILQSALGELSSLLGASRGVVQIRPRTEG